ncbi:hypothetical protein ACWCXB_27590 [Streptomyces sp. NPDC001514]
MLVMPQMSKVELYVEIRRDHRAGMSMRAEAEAGQCRSRKRSPCRS